MPSSPERPGGALAAGARKVRAVAPWLALAWALSLLLALPLAASVGEALREGLGRSEAAERMRDGFDPLWAEGFAARAQGLARTFEPGVVGVGAVLDGLDALAGGRLLRQHALVLGAGGLYALGWAFLSAGLVSRFAGREGPFVAGAARLFPRFLLLAALAASLYLVLLGPLHAALGRLVAEANRETIDERVHFCWTVGRYAVVWMLVWTVSLTFDWARALAALHDRPPLAENLRAAARLVGRHPARAFGVSAALFGVGVALLLAYWLAAPGADGGSWPAILGAFALGQLYLVGRIALRAWFLAAQTEMVRALDR